MTDITKYRNVSLTHDTYKTLISLSKVLLPDATLSISKTIESIANEKAKKLNGKIKKSCPTCKGNGYIKVATEGQDTVHQCWDCDSEGEFYEIDDMGWIDDGTSDSLH
jgi:DnaJ-class molecular chaperone